MKNIALFGSLFFYVTLCQSQSTFNKRLHFNFPAATLTGVIATDSCYYATGIIADSIPPFKTGNIFVKFDLDGNIIQHKTLRDTLQTFEVWNPTLQSTSDSNFVAAGYTIDTIGLKTLLLKFNPEGDTLFTKMYPSYFGDSLFVRLEDFKITPDSGFIFINSARNPEGIGNTDITIIKTDSEGNIEWHKPYGTLQRDEKPRSIINDMGGYIVGAMKDNGNLVNQNFVIQNYIFKINGEGEILWEYFSSEEELFGGANGIISHHQDGWVILSRKGIEVPINANAGQPRWDNYIYKLNEDQTIEWEIDLKDSTSIPGNTNYLRKIINVDDNNYVIAGNVTAFSVESPGHYGNILKITSDGQIIWSRYYRYIENLLGRHYSYDLSQSPDGGFIMVGQVWALDQTAPPPRQQAWLLKVDEYGCLVPGCHLINSTEEKENEVSLLLYPNPTSDYLNFYFDPSTYKEVQFRILDSSGRITKTINSDRIATTYIVPIYDYAPGAYFLQILEQGNLLTTEQFVVVK